VYLHGLAGDLAAEARGEAGLVAGDVGRRRPGGDPPHPGGGRLREPIGVTGPAAARSQVTLSCASTEATRAWPPGSRGARHPAPCSH
jgi:hypothetical protein